MSSAILLSFGGVETVLMNRQPLSAEANGRLFCHIWKGVLGGGKRSIGQVVHDIHARARTENTEQTEAADGLGNVGALQLLNTVVLGLPCARIE